MRHHAARRSPPWPSPSPCPSPPAAPSSTDAAAPARVVLGRRAPRTSITSSAPRDMTAMPFGPGCAAVPADGAGSFSGMATDPVATAASNNPLLSTLVTAVGKAGLGETLNTAKDITVFAPTNDAFAGRAKATMDEAMATRRACSPPCSPTTSSRAA